MKKFAVFLATLLAAVFLLVVCAACTPAETGDPGDTPGEPETPDPGTPDEGVQVPENAIILTSSNATNTATAYFDASYSDTGVTLEAYVVDDDIKTDIYYSWGYDDNVEYLIGTKYEGATGWNAGNTLHFLISADGDTTLQRAVTATTFGAEYALDLLCVNGVNFSYSSELTDYGYKTSVYFGYDLLGTDAAAGRNNIYVCPAMRNTHDYADTVWTPFREGGCNWSNASTFLRIDEEEGYFIDKSLETGILVIGDSAADPSNWLTFGTDTKAANGINLASDGMKIADWIARVPSVAEYAPQNVFVCAGTDELKNADAESIVNELGTLYGALRAALPSAGIFAVTLPGTADASLAEKVRQVNEGIVQAAAQNGISVADAAAQLSADGVLKAGFSAADGVHLNQLGYNVLARLLRSVADVAGGTSSQFGDGSMFAASASLTERSGVSVLDGPYDQYAYFSGCGGGEFFASVQISATSVYNDDAYPKFGIVISSPESTVFFYIDGGNGLTNQRVGYVIYEDNNTWNWSQSVESTCTITYTGGAACELSVLCYQGYLFLRVNGETVFTLSGLDAYGLGGACDVGVLSFNTAIELCSPVYTEENLADHIG